VTQEVELLPSKHEALGSNFNTKIKEKDGKEKEKKLLRKSEFCSQAVEGEEGSTY
jgi:hypothetical protein